MITIKQISMNRTTKNRINRKIHSATANNQYHDTIMLGAVCNILNEYGYDIIQEDYTPWDGIICGASGQAYFDIALNPITDTECTVVKNARLAHSWHKMSSGRYEIVSYVA